MRAYFKPTHTAPRLPLVPLSSTQSMDLTDTPSGSASVVESGEMIFMGYLSDISDDKSMPEDADCEDSEKEVEAVGIPATNKASTEPSFPIRAPPALKR